MYRKKVMAVLLSFFSFWFIVYLIGVWFVWGFLVLKKKVFLHD